MHAKDVSSDCDGGAAHICPIGDFQPYQVVKQLLASGIDRCFTRRTPAAVSGPQLRQSLSPSAFHH